MAIRILTTVLFLATFSSASAKIAETAAETVSLKKGARVPNKTIRTTSDEKKSLKQLLNKKPAALIFYRGGWCPYCNRQLKDLGAVQKELLKLGIPIYAISPDQPKLLAESKEKHGLKYDLISDSSMELSKAFGVAFRVDRETVKKYKKYGIDLEKSSGHKHHLLPVPSVFLVSSDGKIQYAYSNADYKVRLDSNELVKVAKSLQ